MSGHTEWRWVDVPPHTRTIMVGELFTRVRFPQHTVFLVGPPDCHEDSSYGTCLHAWAADEPLGPDTRLYVHPLCHSTHSGTHVYTTGAVCFAGGLMRRVMAREVDAVEAFWNSPFSIAPSWLYSIGRRGGVVSAPVSHADTNPVGLYIRENASPHGAVTPRRIVRDSSWRKIPLPT